MPLFVPNLFSFRRQINTENHLIRLSRAVHSPLVLHRSSSRKTDADSLIHTSSSSLTVATHASELPAATEQLRLSTGRLSPAWPEVQFLHLWLFLSLSDYRPFRLQPPRNRYLFRSQFCALKSQNPRGRTERTEANRIGLNPISHLKPIGSD